MSVQAVRIQARDVPGSPALPEEKIRDEAPATSSGAAGLATRRARVEWMLGVGLRRFRNREFDPMELGERTVGSLARNCLGISATDASEFCCLADGLDRFEGIRSEFLSGRLTRSHVRQLLRVVEPETEAGWLALASELPVAALRETVNAYLREARLGHAEEDGQEFVDVVVRGRARDVHYLRHVGRDLVEKVMGHRLPLWKVVEILCAEFASEYAALVAKAEEGPEPVVRRAGLDVVIPEREWLSAQSRKTYGSTGEGDGDAVLPSPLEADSAEGLVSILVELMKAKQGLAWEMGKALEAREATSRSLGISERWARGLRSVYRKLESAPAVRSAYRNGELGWIQVKLLLRIASPATEVGWVQRARRVTLRRLEAEVEAMEGLRDLGVSVQGPPDDTLLRELGILPGGFRRADAEALVRAANVRIDTATSRRAKNRFRAPPEVAMCIRSTFRALRWVLKSYDEGEAVRLLIDYFASVYEKEAKALMGRHAVLERDGFSCTFPGCSSRRLETHHIRFRSQGGSDDPSNLTSLCPAHHRAGVHGGRISIEGTAPDRLVFRAGNRMWRGEELELNPVS